MSNFLVSHFVIHTLFYQLLLLSWYNWDHGCVSTAYFNTKETTKEWWQQDCSILKYLNIFGLFDCWAEISDYAENEHIFPGIIFRFKHMSNPEHKPGTVKLVLSYKNFTWLIPRFIKSCTCTLSHLSQHIVKHVHHFLNGKMLILKIPPCFYFILLSSLFLRESILMNFTSKMPELARRLVLHYHHSVSPVSAL